jgi:hypothetical protein
MLKGMHISRVYCIDMVFYSLTLVIGFSTLKKPMNKNAKSTGE